MPDDRLIHLTLGHSEKINRLTDFERCVWLMYKLAADDFGIMRLSAAPLQDAAYWLERRPARQVLKALETIRDTQLVATFIHQGVAFVYQRDWQTWQKITHPRQTKQPIPPPEVIALCDANTRWLFTHHPKGGKLRSWQAPTETKPGEHREDTGSSPGKDPVKTGPVFVGVGSVGVRGCVGGEPAAPKRTHTAGLMASSRPVNHGDCLAHGPVCFRPHVAGQFLGRFGDDHAAMVRWAESVCEDWTERVGRGLRVDHGDDFAFWRARYTESFRGETDGKSKLTAALEKAGQW